MRMRALASAIAALPLVAACAGDVRAQGAAIGDDVRTLGSADAAITIVEYADYGCVFCRRHAETTRQQIRGEFVDAGKVRYVFRDFPLDRLHPNARKAAEAARCAGDQGRFWEMNELLFVNQRMLGSDDLKLHATGLGLDEDAFDRCLDEGTHARAVRDDEAAGRADGVVATPTFVIARRRTNGTVATARIVGARPIAAFREAIDRLQ